MKIKSIFFLFSALVSWSVMAQQVIPLYDGPVPNATTLAQDKPESNEINTGFVRKVTNPELTAYLPEKGKSTGQAVIICPGGGYTGLMMSYEGHEMAKMFQENGIAGFVLRYRLPNPEFVENKSIVPLQDAQRAIQLVREHAENWQINPNKIGILGNSAGGHLASTAGTHFETSYIPNPKQTSLRPDFMILNYPVISFADSITHAGSKNNLIGPTFTPNLVAEYSNELQVTEDTPPTFLIHAVDDKTVPILNSVYFMAALQKNKVPVEAFFYAKGGHGFGMKNRTSDVQWVQSCLAWLSKIN